MPEQSWITGYTPMQKRVAVKALADALTTLLELNGVGIFSTDVDQAAAAVQRLLIAAVEAV